VFGIRVIRLHEGAEIDTQSVHCPSGLNPYAGAGSWETQITALTICREKTGILGKGAVYDI